ncbi:MAG: type II and III secretion system protein family protein [Beijerinckiaceae bacterium]|nr:type II and III secretion system protein family protein [Beijerinckiaceae bacterium]MCI0736759.1 type II and III secretion system protein family protein [Beijerinckiaceae bacterium]
MKRLIPLFASGLMAILSALACSQASHAQVHAGAPPSSGFVPRRVSMGVGKSVIVDLPQDAAEIFVANPKVANALVRSPRKLYLIGMDAGQTTVFALDHDGHKIAAFELSIGRDIGELQQILRAAMPLAAITARTVNDTIILTGTVDSTEEAQRAGDIAKGFVQRVFAGGAPGAAVEGLIINTLTIRGRDQVMLKVTVAEIGRDVAKQLGITASSLTASWGTFTQFNPFAIKNMIAPPPNPGIGYPSIPPPRLGDASLSAHNPANTLSATLQAFERNGVTRILAEPTVSAVSGESAKLTVGGQIPIPGPSICGTNTGCTGGGTIFKDYGVALRFSPVVLAEGRILLHIATEVTEIDTQTAAVVFGTVVPGFLTRKNETTVEIPSGGSIASAGLLQTISRQAINGLPGLLDLPVLGSLFRSRDYQRRETELMIVVTPYIIKPAQPNEIARPTDGFADASDPQAWLLGRINRLYASPGNPEAMQDYKGPVGFIQD